MLKILTKESVAKTMASLTYDQLAQLNLHYRSYTCTDDRTEFPLEQFHRDIVTEVAYRFHNGRDGNWDEFDAQWQLPYQTYETVLAAMMANGFRKEWERW